MEQDWFISQSKECLSYVTRDVSAYSGPQVIYIREPSGNFCKSEIFYPIVGDNKESDDLFGLILPLKSLIFSPPPGLTDNEFYIFFILPQVSHFLHPSCGQAQFCKI